MILLIDLICLRYRVEYTEKIAEDIKKSWIPPEIGNLHWDGKMNPSLNSKYIQDERLSVLVSGEFQ